MGGGRQRLQAQESHGCDSGKLGQRCGKRRSANKGRALA